MTEKKIAKGNNHTGPKGLTKGGSTDRPALEAWYPHVGGVSATLVAGKKQDDISLVNDTPNQVPDVTDRLFETALELSKGVMKQYDEQYGHATAMYRHYSESAVNGSDVDVSGMLTADEMALKWLEESRVITKDKKDFLEKLLSEGNKSKIEREKIAANLQKEKIKSGHGPKNVTQNNSTLIIGENNRDRIMKLEELTGGVSGQEGLPNLNIVNKNGFNGVLPGDYEDPDEDTIEAEIETSTKEKKDESEDDWLHDDNGGEQQAER